MTLRITKASDPINVERLVVCIYGSPGLGKTTLCFTAADPLLLDCDNGVYRAGNRKDAIRVQSWSDISNISKEDVAGYKTICVDTAGRLLDFLALDIIAENPKNSQGGGSLSLKGFGVLKSRFYSWLTMMKGHGLDIVLACHMDEQRQGDDVIERLDVQGGSKGEIYKSSDAMGRLLIQNRKRVIDFSPREHSFGKNPAQLDVLEIPDIKQNDHFLADVIQRIKDSINKQAEEHTQEVQAITEWKDAIASFTTVEEFNRNLAAIKKQSPALQKAFAKRAKECGFVYNVGGSIYEVPAQQEALLK